MAGSNKQPAARALPVADSSAAAARPLPAGFRLRLSDGAAPIDGGRGLLGASPTRLVRLSVEGAEIVDCWRRGEPVGTGRPGQALARRLLSIGLVEPLNAPGIAGIAGIAGTGAGAGEPVGCQVEVVVPVRDRPEALARLLASLGTAPAVVVDDASSRPEETVAAAQRAGARVVCLDTHRGPGGARNAGLAATSSPIVAFVDSDCVVAEGWLEPLLAHFADPLVAAVAPRIASSPTSGGLLHRQLEIDRPALDRGGRGGLVAPGRTVPFVPTATLLVRREAVADACFDEALTGGEDVDLVWRLHRGGWLVRYEPAVTVHHVGPPTPARQLRRRYRYGASAGELARRHPGVLAPATMSPWTAASWALVALGRPLLGSLAVSGAVGLLARRLRGRVGQPVRLALRIAGAGSARALAPAVANTARAYSPALAAGLLFGRTRRLAAAWLLVPALRDWAGARRASPLPYLAAHLLDDLAYGCGLWRGCAGARTLEPLMPRLGSARRSHAGSRRRPRSS